MNIKIYSYSIEANKEKVNGKNESVNGIFYPKLTIIIK